MAQLGMVGIGAMGSSLLGRLRLAGLNVTVYDCHQEAQAKAISMGAKGVSSAAAVAEVSSIIDVVVRTNEEMLDCMLGEKGFDWCQRWHPCAPPQHHIAQNHKTNRNGGPRKGCGCHRRLYGWSATRGAKGRSEFLSGRPP